MVGCRLKSLLIRCMTLSRFLNFCASVFSSVKWNYNIYLAVQAPSVSVPLNTVRVHSTGKDVAFSTSSGSLHLRKALI